MTVLKYVRSGKRELVCPAGKRGLTFVVRQQAAVPPELVAQTIDMDPKILGNLTKLKVPVLPV